MKYFAALEFLFALRFDDVKGQDDVWFREFVCTFPPDTCLPKMIPIRLRLYFPPKHKRWFFIIFSTMTMLLVRPVVRTSARRMSTVAASTVSSDVQPYITEAPAATVSTLGNGVTVASLYNTDGWVEIKKLIIIATVSADIKEQMKKKKTHRTCN